MSASQPAQAPAAAQAPATAASASSAGAPSNTSTTTSAPAAAAASTSGDLRRVKSGLSCAECRRCAYISLPCVNHRRLGLSNLLRSPSSPTTLLHITDSDYVLFASCPASDIQFKAQVRPVRILGSMALANVMFTRCLASLDPSLVSHA